MKINAGPEGFGKKPSKLGLNAIKEQAQGGLVPECKGVQCFWL